MLKKNNRMLLREVSVLNVKNNGYSAKLMKAKRLVGDYDHNLPSGRTTPAIPIHCLPGAPDGWIRDTGSYVVKVDSESGLWFDWRYNDIFNTAIVPTVKGMNPITGMKTENVFMQQYREKCPKHNIPFAHELYCEKCGYKWPGQNYISSPNTLWLDGFRQADGTVRQFFFTEEDMRDVASAVMGKENTVPAFGFAFYRCKNERRPNANNSMNNCGSETISASSVNTGIYNYFKQNSSITDAADLLSYNLPNSITGGPSTNLRADEFREFRKNLIKNNRPQDKGHIRTTCLNKEKSFSQKNDRVQERFTKDVSVGAGARILQNIKLDTTPISEWGEKPEALITLYFVFEEQLETIIEKGGIRKLENNPEGYLENIPVG